MAIATAKAVASTLVISSSSSLGFPSTVAPFEIVTTRLGPDLDSGFTNNAQWPLIVYKHAMGADEDPDQGRDRMVSNGWTSPWAWGVFSVSEPTKLKHLLGIMSRVRVMIRIRVYSVGTMHTQPTLLIQPLLSPRHRRRRRHCRHRHRRHRRRHRHHRHHRLSIIITTRMRGRLCCASRAAPTSSWEAPLARHSTYNQGTASSSPPASLTNSSPSRVASRSSVPTRITMAAERPRPIRAVAHQQPRSRPVLSSALLP